MSTLIIVGSSRSNGNTMQIAERLKLKTGADLLDLRDKTITPFDYDIPNTEDDFLPIMRHLVETYDKLIFATPVYWYSMSAVMKTFFDRLTDCLKHEKETGRKLRGKSMGVISCSNASEGYSCLFEPFERSAGYLGMTYLGGAHTWIQKDVIPQEVDSILDAYTDKLNLVAQL